MTPDTGSFNPQVHLCLLDLVYVHTKECNHLEIQIKASKMGQFRQGTKVVLGFTGKQLCPVLALLDYLMIRGGSPGALFKNQDGSPMQRRQFVQEVQQALRKSGAVGQHFNNHSFRIGAATSASQVEVPETVIKILGRWSSMSYQRYIRPSTNELAAVARDIAGTQSRQPPPKQ